MDWNNPPLPGVEHRLRESRRRLQFQGFLEQGRHEFEGIPRPSYCERTVKRASEAFRLPVQHFRGILTGAACSLAMQRAMRRDDVGRCDFCNTDAVRSWQHLAWHCKHFAPTKALCPVGDLQARFGWSHHCDAEYGKSILHHLATVRQAVQEVFYAHTPHAQPWDEGGQLRM